MTTQQLLALLLATIAQFLVGAIWYTPLFGKLWGKIHGFDKLDAKKQKEMMSKMGPIFGVQIIITLVTSYFFVFFHSMMGDYSLYSLTFWIWLGFVVPAQIAGILFGGTEAKWMATKSAVMAGGSLAALMTGAWVVKMWLG